MSIASVQGLNELTKLYAVARVWGHARVDWWEPTKLYAAARV